MNPNNPYYLPKEEYWTVIHYARQYPAWLKELRTIPDTSKAISYDGERVQTSGGYDSTAEVAMRRAMLDKKRKLVEDTAQEAGKEIAVYLLRGVTLGTSFDDLKGQGLPCEKDMYYNRRRRFYWLLAQKI